MEKKKLTKKATALLVSLVLLLTVTVGSTLAYLIDKTDAVVNMFAPSKVTVEVQETFTNNVKSNVIKNTGDIPAYIRAAVVITWQDDAGNVYGKAPVVDTDYTIEWGQTKWANAADGFYYYTEAVPAGGSTEVLIESVEPVSGKAPDGYLLCVEILASGIQADGVNGNGEAVVDAWGVNPTTLG